MKKFEDFIKEVKECRDEEELEASVSQFDFYRNKKNGFNKYQQKMFLSLYNEISNKFITDAIYQKDKSLNYLRLMNIVRGADEVLKSNIETLTNYCRNIDRQLKSKARIA